MKKIIYITMLGALSFSALSFNALSAEKQSTDEVAKELANPTSALASLHFKFQTKAFTGDLPNADDQQSNSILFQPSMPFPLDSGAKILFRPAIPFYIDTPVFMGTDFSDESGIGDSSIDLMYSPKAKDGVSHAFGAYITLPTGDEKVGQGETTTLGPEYYYVKMAQDSAVGILAFHHWDIAGDIKVSQSTSQVFLVALPGGGWNYGTQPTFTYDWENEQWTVPLNFNVGRTVQWNERPWKLSVELDYYVEKNEDFGPDWMLTFRISPVVENVMASWF
ncbi:hypothetical protein RGQ13_07750 [Thalassotalea psychrophila]|uniref:Neuromedin U n=1 Tax=Thalassotalea psychrophila TaxID=3065647 RepID=A0ABY9TYD4_9GAMM|nr:hypothetical protein RGQ13_07750 [Colwelliaceae bacterium SQ149]